MAHFILEDTGASPDDLEFGQIDGYWVQATGSNILGFNDNYGRLLLAGLNTGREKAYGVRNKDGIVVYEQPEPFKKLRMYYDWYERDHGDGFYPFTDADPAYPAFVDIWFVLTNDGDWSQQNERAIEGLDGNGGSITLTALNGDVHNGRCIRNRWDKMLFPKN